jgi:hypothetical protein
MAVCTLVTACISMVDLKIRHALFRQPSSCESRPVERQPQVYRTVGDAVRATRATNPDNVTIPVGPTDLSTDPRSIIVTMFVPCPDIVVSARRIAQVGECCKSFPHFKNGPIYCAIVTYPGAWKRPNNAFAAAVTTSVANNAPELAPPDAARPMPSASGLQFSLPAPLCRCRLHRTIVIAAGRAPLSGPDSDRLAGCRFIVQREAAPQPSRKRLALRARVRDQRRRTCGATPFDVRTIHRLRQE